MKGSSSFRTSTLLSAGAAGLAIGVAAAVLLASPSDGPAHATALRDVEAPAASAPHAATTAASTEGTEAESNAAREEEARRRAAAVAAVASLERAHEALHADEDDAGLAAAMGAALEEQLSDDKARRRLVSELLGKVGVGRFVAGGYLTPLGAAVRARLDQLEIHAVDTAPYDVAGIDVILGAREGAGMATGEVTPAAKAVAALLSAPAFDREGAVERLMTLDAIPGASELSMLTATVAAQRGLAKATAADVPADVALARTLVQLTLDYRFVRQMGPFGLRKADTVLDKPKERAELVALVRQAVEGGDEAALAAALDATHPFFEPMVAVHRTYLGYTKEECPTLPESWRIRPGQKGDAVKTLQRRLTCEGYYDGPIDGVYEGTTILAARSYQAHHELEADGDVGKSTIKSLNVPMSRRVEQIRWALMRMREGTGVREMGDFYIRVNLPAFEMQVFDHGKVIRRHRVIVGTNRLDDDKQALVQGHLNRTPLLTTRLYQVVVNPRWILPKRIVEGELQTKLAEDPDYLEKNNIRKVELDDGRELLVQAKGDDNVLGKVKFLLEKTNHIYLHDTDKRHLFKEKRRDFSHGCMRVDGAIEFGKWALARDGWEEREIDRTFGGSAERGMDLKRPIDLFTDYVTVDIAEDGLPIFLTDIYGYDGAYERGQLPPTTRTRWGAIQLRPRWVPTVSRATVDGWRAKGMAAPRDYDPKVHGE